MKISIQKRIFALLLLASLLASLCLCTISCSFVPEVPGGSANETVSPTSDELVLIPNDDETLPAVGEQSPPELPELPEPELPEQPDIIDLDVEEDGEYDDCDHVALYLHLYGHLPNNYITKAEAENLGWSGGSVEKVAKGKCIGGSYFGNYEGLLPKKKGRSYYECDIDTLGKSSRGAKRIIYSNDGLIYYTDDHYESFTLLYGEE